MSKRFILLLLATILGISTICLVVLLNRHPGDERAERRIRMEQNAHTRLIRMLSQTNVMSKEEANKLQQITDGIKQTHSISDVDLDWMLTLLNKPSNQTSNPVTIHMLVLGALELAVAMTPTQKTKMLEAVTPLFSSSRSIDRAQVTSAMAKLKITQATSFK